MFCNQDYLGSCFILYFRYIGATWLLPAVDFITAPPPLPPPPLALTRSLESEYLGDFLAAEIKSDLQFRYIMEAVLRRRTLLLHTKSQSHSSPPQPCPLAALRYQRVERIDLVFNFDKIPELCKASFFPKHGKDPLAVPTWELSIACNGGQVSKARLEGR